MDKPIAIFDIVPVGKPRMTQRDKWAKRPAVMKYRAFADELRWYARVNNYKPKDSLKADFFLPMPKSWSKKKREQKNLTPHDQKPDIDNMIKAFLDVLMEEDKLVAEVHCRKFWGETGRIIIY